MTKYRKINPIFEFTVSPTVQICPNTVQNGGIVQNLPYSVMGKNPKMDCAWSEKDQLNESSCQRFNRVDLQILVRFYRVYLCLSLSESVKVLFLSKFNSQQYPNLQFSRHSGNSHAVYIWFTIQVLVLWQIAGSSNARLNFTHQGC